MFFAIGEEVIPYVNRVNGDEPLSRYESFTKKFKIQNIKLINDGAIWQELDLLESGIIGVSSYNLTITQGANTTITVTRTSSPYQHAQLGTLISGNTIYYGDVLTVSVNASSGFTASYSGFISGSSVDGAVNIISVATPNTYTLTLNQGTGSTLVVTRTSSPYKHAQTGTLYNGNEIYFGDILTVAVSAQSGYENPTYSGFVSGSSVNGNVTITSSADVHIPSWHTVFSGSQTGKFTGIVSADEGDTPTRAITIPLNNIGITTDAVPTRITGRCDVVIEGFGNHIDFENVEVITSAQVLLGVGGFIYNALSKYECKALMFWGNYTKNLICYTKMYYSHDVWEADHAITYTITKVEQYY